MRSDMHKVVIERPRFGHANPSRKWGGRVSENHDGPTFVSSARNRQYGWNAKGLSDFLSPLMRYLEGQVGRPWDKVYSEIRKGIPRGLHADHLWSHIRSAVQLNCFERDGEVFAWTHYFFGEVKVSGLYVHPRTGLLCFKPKPSRKPRTTNVAASATLIQRGELEEYRKINGIWYYRKFIRLDVAGPPVLQVVEKKQLNRRELRELGIENVTALPAVAH
jgi:hypothetical protein